ncbi:YdcF family protein [Ruminococcus sp. HUN007]|uniref:YdcF family protein n=1 Tax=Ruminococcus sp. HUN007 TaxID=1514668 RepID=UPI000678CC73|nr:YdcF family protein [Ruminococcus sp. HUN007]
MIIKIIVAALEILLFMAFAVSYPVINIGTWTGMGVTAVLFIITLRFESFVKLICNLWQHTSGKAVLGITGFIVIASVGFAVFCTVNMLSARNIKPEDPSAVVVLGCQVRNGVPSRMLKRRLDAALTYLETDTDVPVVVSGGQGPDEAISEAECMKRYLAEHGIPESRIIMEDKSANTDENLVFSFEKLDERGISRDIVLVSDGYHQYRAQHMAKRHGAVKVSAVSAATEPKFIATYYVREWLAIAKELFLS